MQTYKTAREGTALWGFFITYRCISVNYGKVYLRWYFNSKSETNTLYIDTGRIPIEDLQYLEVFWSDLEGCRSQPLAGSINL